jgi:hypothetical protein
VAPARMTGGELVRPKPGSLAMAPGALAPSLVSSSSLHPAMDPNAANSDAVSSPTMLDGRIRIGLVAVLVYGSARIVLPFAGLRFLPQPSIKDLTLGVGASPGAVEGALIAGVSRGSPAEHGGSKKETSLLLLLECLSAGPLIYAISRGNGDLCVLGRRCSSDRLDRQVPEPQRLHCF